MKHILLPVVAGLALTGCMTDYGWSEAPLGQEADAAGAPVQWWGRDVASVDVFYGELAGTGTWGIHPRYGRVFYPQGVGAGWQPYSRGYWREDPRYGRTWISSEPWGWATYHYGRWGRDSRLGWFWVPDTRFGPSWVDWRAGSGYASWSPLPPYGWDRYGYGYGNDWWVSAPAPWLYRPGMGGQWRPGRHDHDDRHDRGDHHDRDDNWHGRPPGQAQQDPPRPPFRIPPGSHPRSDPIQVGTSTRPPNPAWAQGERQPQREGEGRGRYVGGERQPTPQPGTAWQGGERPGFPRTEQHGHPRSTPQPVLQTGSAGFARQPVERPAPQVQAAAPRAAPEPAAAQSRSERASPQGGQHPRSSGSASRKRDD